ncbi:MAG: tetracycline efflux MFS transporter Tet(A) [Thermodesulfobacteriota bacterium]|nr:MAG: tetracycline efflux MFS transporter Tet(A) [Thermodesulfobacteriota bacterium]
MLSAGMQPNKTDLHPLMPLYLVILVAFAGYGLMVSIFIPMLMHDTGFFDKSVPTSTRAIYGGILLALYPLGQFIGAPVIGSLADKFGRKRVLMISLVFTIFFYVIIAYSIDIRFLWLLMGTCFLAGLTESNVAICQSAIADVSTEDDRGRLFSYLYTAMSLGYFVGPLAGGQLAVHFKLSSPFWITAVFLVFVYLWVLISFKDSYVPDINKKISYFKTFTNLSSVFTDIPIRRVYLINFLIYFGVFGLARVIQIYLVDEWNFSIDKVTLYIAALSGICAISNLFFFAPLSKRFSLRAITIWTSIIGGIMILIIVIPKSEYSIWFTSIPAFFILVWAISACGAYISTLVDQERQGRVLGNNLALQVGAESIGAAIGGFLAAMFVPLPILVYGVVTILGGLLLITYKKHKEPESIPDGD